MNQILMTNDEKGSSSKGMKSIIKFFSIAIIVFAIILIAIGGFYLYNSIKNKKDFPKPELSSEKNGSSLNLILNGEIGINKFVYSWNGGKETTLPANGKKSVNFEIQIPQGENKLKSYAIDVEGNKTKFEDFTVSFTAVEDTVKPVITIENSNGKLDVSATDETEIDYFTYQWEDGEEVKLERSEGDKKLIKKTIDVEKGTKKLTLVAVDKSGNKKTVTKKIVGSNGPAITAVLSNGNFVVTITDEIEITKIEYTHNDEQATVNDIPKGAKEYKLVVPLKEGDNYLKVNAYENSIMTEYKCKKTK